MLGWPMAKIHGAVDVAVQHAPFSQHLFQAPWAQLRGNKSVTSARGRGFDRPWNLQLLPKPQRRRNMNLRPSCPTAQSATQCQLLHVAARYGMVPLLDRLLFIRHVSPNARIEGQLYPLALAIEHGHREAAILLLAAGASPFGEGSLGYTNLQQAIAQGWPDVVRMLLEAHVDPQGIRAIRTPAIHWGVPLMTSFHSAISLQDNLEMFRLLLQYCPKPNISSVSWNLIHHALWVGNLDAIPLLLEAGESVSAKDVTSCKPLTLALWLHRDRALIDTLLKKMPQGATTFHLIHLATLWDDEQILQQLFRHVSFRFIGKKGPIDHGTGLHMAIVASRPRALKALLTLHHDYLQAHPHLLHTLASDAALAHQPIGEWEWPAPEHGQAWDVPSEVLKRRSKVLDILAQAGCPVPHVL